MKNFGVIFIFIYLIGSSVAVAQQHSYAGVTAEDIGEEQEACAADAYRFCGGNDIALFEMENCLSHHLGQLSKACRAQIAPTDFKKYYQEEAHPFELD
jgi:hypothetical protein